MKARLLFIVAVVFLTALSGSGWAIENPVGVGTVPPTSIRSGLIRSPNPIDTSGNLIITGNVRGGRHFRGIVPYRAGSAFGAATGSSSLDSFLRRSAGSEDFGPYSGGYKPYYSPSATVTTTRPGLPGVFRPETTKIRGRSAVETALQSMYIERALPGTKTALSFRRLRGPQFAEESKMGTRPMSMGPQELEKVILDELGTYSRGRRLTAEQRQARLEQFQRDLKQVSDRAAKLEQILIKKDESTLRSKATTEDGSFRLSAESEPSPTASLRKQEAGQRFETQAPKEQAGEYEPLDVYEQMKQQIYSLQEGFEQLLIVRQTGEAADVKKEPDEPRPYYGGDEEEPQFGISPKIGTQEGSLAEKLSGKIPVIPIPSGLVTTPGLSEVDLSIARAKGFLGSRKSFASFSEDRFNHHLRAAEEYLKQGKYYHAADAYTLASIYKPDDPLAYAGKSHALFAAGEYMSSALFLSRALEIFPEYARFKIDIVAMVGDRDKLESRIVDVEQWLERSDAAELHFLLGYVYYQMGRLGRAEEAIDAAYEKMPDRPKAGTIQSSPPTAGLIQSRASPWSLWPAVIALREAIYDAVK